MINHINKKESLCLKKTIQNSKAPRNPYANHPLMRRSAVHEKFKSAERSKTRREIKQLARDWSSKLQILIFQSLLETIGDSPFFVCTPCMDFILPVAS